MNQNSSCFTWHIFIPDIDECSSSPCSGKTCHDGVNYYFCACPENYMGPDCSQCEYSTYIFQSFAGENDGLFLCAKSPHPSSYGSTIPHHFCTETLPPRGGARNFLFSPLVLPWRHPCYPHLPIYGPLFHLPAGYSDHDVGIRGAGWNSRIGRSPFNSENFLKHNSSISDCCSNLFSHSGGTEEYGTLKGMVHSDQS